MGPLKTVSFLFALAALTWAGCGPSPPAPKAAGETIGQKTETPIPAKQLAHKDRIVAMAKGMAEAGYVFCASQKPVVDLAPVIAGTEPVSPPNTGRFKVFWKIFILDGPSGLRFEDPTRRYSGELAGAARTEWSRWSGHLTPEADQAAGELFNAAEFYWLNGKPVKSPHRLTLDRKNLGIRNVKLERTIGDYELFCWLYECDGQFDSARSFVELKFTHNGE